MHLLVTRHRSGWVDGLVEIVRHREKDPCYPGIDDSHVAFIDCHLGGTSKKAKKRWDRSILGIVCQESTGRVVECPGLLRKMGRGLLTCQLVSGSPETNMRKIVRRGRGMFGRSIGPGRFSLRRGPRAN